MRTVSGAIEGIHFKDNICVYIKHKKEIEYDADIEGALNIAKEAIEEWENKIRKSCIVYRDYKEYNYYTTEGQLFGGRVLVKCLDRNNSITIDGLQVYSMQHGEVTDEFSFEEATAILNAMATYGVDGFLKNYRENLQEWRTYYTEQLEGEELVTDASESDEINEKVLKLKNTIKTISSIVYALLMHMTLSIENEVIQNIYNQIIAEFA
ncbi:hypothetical protein [Saccharicrinis sp. 156]|uniref:hypothetical protein n=1 Tax=Saccharicrinis sp. 156 TaxID=3417574 RepID=UPI003D341F26